jgi:hypothetical protein
MFSDTLMHLERAHLMQLILWGAAGVLAGTAVTAGLAVSRARSPLLTTFAFVTLTGGAIELCAGVARWHTLAMRDLAAATRLDRYLWLATGLDIGLLAIGLTFAVACWQLGRRLGPVGAGIGLIVQGAALLALHTRFLLRLEGML